MGVGSLEHDVAVFGRPDDGEEPDLTARGERDLLGPQARTRRYLGVTSASVIFTSTWSAPESRGFSSGATMVESIRSSLPGLCGRRGTRNSVLPRQWRSENAPAVPRRGSAQ